MAETWHYGHDAVGNITSRGTDPEPANATHSYSYDELYRLINEINPNNTDQYSYDANSNRTEFIRDGGSTSYQIDPNSNRLDQVDSDQITHDDAGNITSDRNGSRTFSYNQAGRLSEVYENGTLVASYSYNALGQRTSKTTQTGTTYYLYGPGGQLLGEYDQTGQPVKEYVHLNGEPLAQVDDTSITYLHTDHLATPRKATDEAGAVVWQWDSEAFGNKLPESSGATVNLRFPGQYYDQETGLHYNYFRTYNPATGRYLESDPIGLEGGLNTYGYVGGNPVSFVDLLGLIRWTGSFDYFGVDMGIGVIGWDFKLISECKNNIAYLAYIDATAIQVSGGLPLGIGMNSPWDNIDITDTHSTPNPNALSGGFSFSSFGYALGEHSSGGVKVQVGSGTGTYNGDMGSGSIDAGGAGGAGISRVVSFEEINFDDECECEQWNKEHFGG
jgi:RHS repeat-associated protein